MQTSYSIHSQTNTVKSSSIQETKIMSVQVSPAPQSQNVSPNPTTEIVRPIAAFHPDIWGDQFISYISDDEMTQTGKEKQVEQLKQEMRKELLAAAGQPSQQLKFIDALQRLGIAYHFEKDIDVALKHIYHLGHSDNHDKDLYQLSLWFRLLRQQGHNVPSDVFNKLKNDTGSFNEFMTSGVSAMLCLYEATHLRVHGEDVLDQALAFVTNQLESFAATHPTHPLTPQVIHALKQPIHTGLPRVEARYYISVYEEDSSHNKALLKLAKLDFNLLQTLHKKELREITRWWRKLDFVTKLPYARDRVVECYFWILGVFFEPQYSLARIILTKVISLLSILDDTYDAYGTREELELLTDAIHRWDIKCMDQLPEYMKLIYQAILDLYVDIEGDIAHLDGATYRFHYAKEAMKKAAQGFFAEAKCFAEGYIPTMEEYMKLGLQSSGLYTLTSTAFVGMNEVVTKEAFDWVDTEPKSVTASAIIGRLMDDIVSHKFEQQRGHFASSVECYMNQYGVSEQEAYVALRKQVVDAWKDMNQEFLTPPDNIPMYLLMRALNFARTLAVSYIEGDGYTHVNKSVRARITGLLIEPVPV